MPSFSQLIQQVEALAVQSQLIGAQKGNLRATTCQNCDTVFCVEVTPTGGDIVYVVNSHASIGTAEANRIRNNECGMYQYSDIFGIVIDPKRTTLGKQTSDSTATTATAHRDSDGALGRIDFGRCTMSAFQQIKEVDTPRLISPDAPYHRE